MRFSLQVEELAGERLYTDAGHLLVFRARNVFLVQKCMYATISSFPFWSLTPLLNQKPSKV